MVRNNRFWRTISKNAPQNRHDFVPIVKKEPRLPQAARLRKPRREVQTILLCLAWPALRESRVFFTKMTRAAAFFEIAGCRFCAAFVKKPVAGLEKRRNRLSCEPSIRFFPRIPSREMNNLPSDSPSTYFGSAVIVPKNEPRKEPSTRLFFAEPNRAEYSSLQDYRRFE